MPPTSDLHPLVRQAVAALKPHFRSDTYVSSTDDGLLRTPRRHLGIAVSAAQVERAGKVVDAVVRILESDEVGGVIELEKWSYVRVAGERFRFRLKEETTRSDHRPTPAEKRELERHPHINNVAKWDWRATGRLSLEFFGAECSYNPIARLADGKRAKLEDKLGTLPEVVRRLVAAKKAEDAERERRKQEWQEQRQREEAQRQCVEVEKRRVAELLHEARRWRDACLLRDYADALITSANARGLGEHSAEMNRASWAREIAAQLNPLKTR